MELRSVALDVWVNGSSSITGQGTALSFPFLLLLLISSTSESTGPSDAFFEFLDDQDFRSVDPL